MARGRLRIYLGAAPGVGKTYAMLAEGRRRKGRGTDVVVGLVETHGRPRTEEQLGGLEVLPRKTMRYRGATFTELDVEAVIARRPQVALVDELAHTNVPGSRNAKRWQDIDQILDAGIDVISTVNVQHLDSVNDVVEAITGVPQRETVPDEVVRRAGQVELIDMTPEALRRRMAHGNVYAPEKIDAALGNYFRIGNLTALRELALLWLADKVDDQLDRYRADHDIRGTWEARERVVVALTGGPEGETLIRRAARIADRTKGADLLAVHVANSDGLTGADPANLVKQRTLVESLGGTYHQVVGDDVPTALLDFARGVNATQLVLGASRRGRIAQIFSRGVGVTTTALSGTIDVHLVTHEEVSRGRRPRPPGGGLSRWRRVAGFALAVAVLPLLTLLLQVAQPDLSLPSDILLFLLAVVGVGLVGGLRPALFAAVAGSLLLNYYFTPPIHEFTIAERDNLLALVVFVAVAVAVSAVVDVNYRRSREAARARTEAEVLSTLAGGVLRGHSAVHDILQRLRETFALTAVTLLEREPGTAETPGLLDDPERWRIVATAGGPPCPTPQAGETEIPISKELVLAMRGRTLRAEDRRVLEAFAAHAAVALRQQRLSAEAEQVRPLAEADRMRTALLNAVSHDLRTPLASAKAAVDSLRSQDVAWDPEDREELLDTAAESLGRLDRLVANLLDMSRLQAGMLGVSSQRVAVEDIVPRALGDVGRAEVRIRIPEPLPEVVADPALLERVLANLVGNAARHNPPEQPVMVTASAHAEHVEVRVIDRGPGIPPADWDRVFLPFQRLGDRDNGSGVGLGLALSRGLTEAMGGTLTPEETPGGGFTMIVTLPIAGTATDGEPLADPIILDRVAAWRDGTDPQPPRRERP
ncbi:osmosensitive K+ channel signal transduction histidine kinase [Thermomonospora echinospora]|uniref:histidine kinase n=1 Tax=Thermomonospora echinospora TaxID=1992 RepID=A0A1H6DR76_9ACTN|nr:ATP-binding protein [Thermomonospora echinospora]SEG87907.1 osmosensitive K+ channel signal transduction histidine kinase [Thermomonospora echinospora]